MQPTYFKDRRTGAVYTTTEKTLPVTGSIPLKAAYKCDTVWIDRQWLDRVPNPHLPSTRRTLGILAIFMLVGALWVLASVKACALYDTSLLNALWMQAGWSLVLLHVTLRYTGAVKG